MERHHRKESKGSWTRNKQRMSSNPIIKRVYTSKATNAFGSAKRISISATTITLIRLWVTLLKWKKY